MVADNLIKATSYKFVNKETSEIYESTKNIKYSPAVSVQSPENEWYYMNGVVNIAMMQLADYTGEKNIQAIRCVILNLFLTTLIILKDNMMKKYPAHPSFNISGLESLTIMGL